MNRKRREWAARELARQEEQRLQLATEPVERHVQVDVIVGKLSSDVIITHLNGDRETATVTWPSQA